MSDADSSGSVTAYKRLLQAVCDNRPSGTRMRFAAALGTNRSFVSQLVNPAYYDEAHPGRRETADAPARTRTLTVVLPDLGHAKGNQAIDEMVRDYARNLVRLAGTPPD